MVFEKAGEGLQDHIIHPSIFATPKPSSTTMSSAGGDPNNALGVGPGSDPVLTCFGSGVTFSVDFEDDAVVLAQLGGFVFFSSFLLEPTLGPDSGVEVIAASLCRRCRAASKACPTTCTVHDWQAGQWENTPVVVLDCEPAMLRCW